MLYICIFSNKFDFKQAIRISHITYYGLILTRLIWLLVPLGLVKLTFLLFSWRHDIQHGDIQHDDTQHNAVQHNDNQHNAIQQNDIRHDDIPHNDTQHNAIQHNDIQHNNK